MTYIWNEAYEASPSNLVPRDQIRWEIQKAKVGVQDRMGIEHQWGELVIAADQGKHWPGHTTLADMGNAPGSITNPQEGALYVYDDGSSPHLYKLMIYHLGAWIEACTLDHGTLSGLLNDTHTQFLKVNGGIISTGNLDMGANLLMPSSGGGIYEYGQFLTMGHAKNDHSAFGNISAVLNGVITGAKLRIRSLELSGTLPILSITYLNLASAGFVPQILIENGSDTGDVKVQWQPQGIKLWNSSFLFAYPYRVRQRYIY